MGYGRHIVVRQGETWRLRQAIKLAREAMSRGEHKWGHTRPRSEEAPSDQGRRPRPLVPDAQVPDRDQGRERPEEQSKSLPPQQAPDPVRDQSRKDKAEQPVQPGSVHVRDPARDRGPKPTEAHPEGRFPSPPPHKEAAGGTKPTKVSQPRGPTSGDLYKAPHQRQKEEREAQALTAMVGLALNLRDRSPRPRHNHCWWELCRW